MFIQRLKSLFFTPRIADLLDQWLEEHASDIPSHDANERHARNLKTHLHGTRVSDYGPQLREKIVTDFTERGWSASYINRHLMALSASFGHAKRKQRLIHAPIVQLVPQQDHHEKIVFTPNQFAEFIERSKPTSHLFRFVMLSANTAARPSTVLQIGQLQLFHEHGYINLNPPGRRQTKKFRPIVPITSTLTPWLERWTSNPIIHWKGKPVVSVKKSFEKIALEMNLDVSPSCIRHTMATELARASVPKDQRDRFMGHKAPDGARVGERYLHLDPTYLIQARDAIDAYFENLPTGAWRYHP